MILLAGLALRLGLHEAGTLGFSRQNSQDRRQTAAKIVLINRRKTIIAPALYVMCALLSSDTRPFIFSTEGSLYYHSRIHHLVMNL